MANPDQKSIFLEQAYDELKSVFSKFQDESGATDMEVKTLLRDLLGFGKKYWWRLRYRLRSLNLFSFISFIHYFSQNIIFYW